jgi:DNA-binding CsgD family transcriptional regulator
MSGNEYRNKGRRRGDDVYDLLVWHPWFALCTIVVHRDGVFLWASERARQMLGGDVAGVPIHQVVGKEFHALMNLVLQQAMASGEPGPPSEIKYVSLQGEPVFAYVQSYPVIWQGKPALLTVGNDNTGAWRASAALYRILKLRLSPRAMDFLTLRAHNVDYAEIAQMWGVSRLAIKNYPQKIMRRLRTDRAGYDEILDFVRLYFFYENL